MAVPYADPNAPYTRKCAFDVGGERLHLLTRPPPARAPWRSTCLVCWTRSGMCLPAPQP